MARRSLWTAQPGRARRIEIFKSRPRRLKIGVVRGMPKTAMIQRFRLPGLTSCLMCIAYRPFSRSINAALKCVGLGGLILEFEGADSRLLMLYGRENAADFAASANVSSPPRDCKVKQSKKIMSMDT